MEQTATGQMPTRSFTIMSQQMYAQIGFKWDPNRGEYLDSKYGIRIVSVVKEVDKEGNPFGEEYDLNSVVAYPYTSRVEKEQIFHPTRAKVQEVIEAMLRGEIQGFDIDDVSDLRALYEADPKGTIRIFSGIHGHLLYDLKPTRDWKPRIEETLKLHPGDTFEMQVPEGKKPHFIPNEKLLTIGKGVANKKRLPASSSHEEVEAKPIGSMADIPGFKDIKLVLPAGTKPPKDKGKKPKPQVEAQ